MTDHEKLQAELVELAAGRLSADERRRVEEHVASCTACAEALAFAEEVNALSSHPTVTELRAWALGERPTHAEPIESHVRSCPSCNLEAEAWKRQPRSRRGLWVATAAGLLAASLLLAFWVVRGPHAPSHAPQTLRFTVATRGSETEPEAQVDAQRDLTIQADWVPLDPFESVGPLVLEIRSKGGGAWSSERDAASVVETLRAGTGFRLHVPAGTLAPGDHEFRMYRRWLPHEPALVSGRFVVRSPG